MAKQPKVSKFDFSDRFLDQDAEPVSDAPPAEASRPRLGPMATAIRDSAEAAQKGSGSLQIDELETLELAVQMQQLREASLDLRLIDPEAVDTEYLTRDRSEIDRDALEELKRSIKENGLGTPIRVEEGSEGRLLLNQGRRRLLAFLELRAETGDERFAAIPALVEPAGEREAAYRRMVDENAVREDVGFAELAALAIAYAEEAAINADEAVKRLFGSLQRMRRWSIGEFVRVLSLLGSSLRHANELPRDDGLELAKRLKEPGFAEKVREALDAEPERDAAREVAVLRMLLKEGVSKPRRSRAVGGSQIRKLRIKCGPAGERRFDVAITDKKIVISGVRLGQVEEEKLRVFLEEIAQS
jgi:ParB family chromosome partitioning protein